MLAQATMMCASCDIAIGAPARRRRGNWRQQALERRGIALAQRLRAALTIKIATTGEQGERQSLLNVLQMMLLRKTSSG